MASQSTQSHETIQQWAEAHGAIPTIVSRTGGMLRFEFDPGRADSLTPVAWEEFFQVFDEKGLELLYDDKPGSRFHKFVYPETLAAPVAPHPAAKHSRRLEIIGGRERSGSRASLAKPAARGAGKAAQSGASRSRRSLARAGQESEAGESATPARTRSASSRRATARPARRAVPAAAKSKAPKRQAKKAARPPRRSAA